MAIGRLFAFRTDDWIYKEDDSLPWSDDNVIASCKKDVDHWLHRLEATELKRNAIMPKVSRDQTGKTDGDDESQATKNKNEGYEIDQFWQETAELMDGFKLNQSVFKWCWTLVHSKHSQDVHAGILSLRASAGNSNSIFMPVKEKLYLLAVGFYRIGDLPNARRNLERCLEAYPNWNQATTLKKIVESRIRRDGIVGMNISGGLGIGFAGLVALAGPLVATGLVAGGVVAAATASWKTHRK